MHTGVSFRLSRRLHVRAARQLAPGTVGATSESDEAAILGFPRPDVETYLAEKEWVPAGADPGAKRSSGEAVGAWVQRARFEARMWFNVPPTFATELIQCEVRLRVPAVPPFSPPRALPSLASLRSAKKTDTCGCAWPWGPLAVLPVVEGAIPGARERREGAAARHCELRYRRPRGARDGCVRACAGFGFGLEVGVGRRAGARGVARGTRAAADGNAGFASVSLFLSRGVLALIAIDTELNRTLCSAYWDAGDSVWAGLEDKN